MKKTKPIIGYFNYADLITMSGLIFSIIACFLIAQSHYIISMIFYVLALVCDTVDGTVARKLNLKNAHEKSYGIQLDSLCDMVSFGVVPCVMAFFLGYNSPFDVAIYALFSVCGAIRLAHYNADAVLATPETKHDYFIGVPIPHSAIYFILMLDLHLLTVSADGVNTVIHWLFRLFFLALGIGFILRFRFPRPNKNVMMFLGIWILAQFLALIIIVIARGL